jgi:hypothetical protein
MKALQSLPSLVCGLRGMRWGNCRTDVARRSRNHPHGKVTVTVTVTGEVTVTVTVTVAVKVTITGHRNWSRVKQGSLELSSGQRDNDRKIGVWQAPRVQRFQKPVVRSNGCHVGIFSNNLVVSSPTFSEELNSAEPSFIKRSKAMTKNHRKV